MPVTLHNTLYWPHVNAGNASSAFPVWLSNHTRLSHRALCLTSLSFRVFIRYDLLCHLLCSYFLTAPRYGRWTILPFSVGGTKDPLLLLTQLYCYFSVNCYPRAGKHCLNYRRNFGLFRMDALSSVLNWTVSLQSIMPYSPKLSDDRRSRLSSRSNSTRPSIVKISRKKKYVTPKKTDATPYVFIN